MEKYYLYPEILQLSALLCSCAHADRSHGSSESVAATAVVAPVEFLCAKPHLHDAAADIMRGR